MWPKIWWQQVPYQRVGARVWESHDSFVFDTPLNQAKISMKMFLRGKSQMIIDLTQLIVCVLTEVSSGGIRISSHESLSKLLRPHCTVFSFLSLLSFAYFWQFVVQVASHSKSENKYFKIYDFLIVNLNMNSQQWISSELLTRPAIDQTRVW